MEVKGVGIGNSEERQGIEGADGVRESGQELRERESNDLSFEWVR